jgi:hypothetical protein
VAAPTALQITASRTEYSRYEEGRSVIDAHLIAVGGAPYRFDPKLYQKVGADAWAADGVTAAKVIVQLINEVKA